MEFVCLWSEVSPLIGPGSSFLHTVLIRPDKRDWWEGFWKESEARWQTAGAEAAGPKSLAIMTLALGELVVTAPSR